MCRFLEMNFVYVVVSTLLDTYYEQAIISISSLRKHNKNANIFMLVDQKTALTLKGSRLVHKDYDVKIIKIDVPATLKNKEISRFIKTSMLQYINDDFMYIDSDTVICDSLETFDTSIQVGMVLDGHKSFKSSYTYIPNFKLLKKMHFHTAFNDCYYNSGFMWVKNCENAHKLFNLWHKLWKEGLNKYNIILDQPSLNEANYKLNGVIQTVDGEWNCQVARRCPSVKYIYNSKILHYFASRNKNCYDLSDSIIQKTILNKEHLELDKILLNPKSAFSNVVDMNTDLQTLFIEQTSVYSLLKRLYKIKPLFFVLNFICSIFLFLPRKIKQLWRFCYEIFK